jgi:glycosyltransferase involved in cell wall biosynthesis
MQFSICTPTNNSTYLLELYESIVKQSHANWQWILVLNGNVTKNELDQSILNDERVLIYQYDKTGSVGSLKNYAFSIATGDVLVEVDHDDMITPDCLEELRKAFQDETV